MGMLARFTRKGACDLCQVWQETRLVSSPNKLSELIKDVKSAEENGVLEVGIQSTELSEETLDAISINGPWPDIISLRFSCPSCKRAYNLFANTYQGSNKNGWHPKREAHNKTV